MKIFNLSVKELIKNKFYFLYFTVGLALLMAVVCVLANYSDQVFEGFFTQFDHGQTITLTMKAPPRESRYYDELLIIAGGNGVTYNLTVSCKDNSVYLPGYRSGICVVSTGCKNTLEGFSLITWSGFVSEFKDGAVYPTQELADELSCKRGDMVKLGGNEYEVADIIIAPDDYSFYIYDPEIKAEEYTVILSNKDQLLEITEHLNSENFDDSEGLLALCEGFRAMKTAMDIVLVLLASVCAVFIFVFIKMYFSKRGEFFQNLSNMGMRNSQLFAVSGAVFAFLIFIAGTLGYLISVLLDMLVDHWARELIRMHVDKVNYLAYFLVGFAASVIVAAVSLLFNIGNSSESGAKNK